jgi:hypothetical protein
MSDEFTALRAYHQELESRVKWCERALYSRGITPFDTAPRVVPEMAIHREAMNRIETENKLLAQIQRMAEQIAQLQKENAILRTQTADVTPEPGDD